MTEKKVGRSNPWEMTSGGLPPEIAMGAKEIAFRLAPLLKALEAY